MEEQKDLGSYDPDGTADAVSVPSTGWDDEVTVPFNERVKVWAELMLGSEEGAQRKIEDAGNGLR